MLSVVVADAVAFDPDPDPMIETVCCRPGCEVRVWNRASEVLWFQVNHDWFTHGIGRLAQQTNDRREGVAPVAVVRPSRRGEVDPT